MSLEADAVLGLLVEHAHVMGTLDSGACAIQHVSARNPDGPDKRLDYCPCDRKYAPGEVDAMDQAARSLLDLGGSQYVSSALHTLGDLVRDVVGQE